MRLHFSSVNGFRKKSNPEVNLGGPGADSHDHGGVMNTCLLFNFDKKGGICASKKSLSENLLHVLTRLKGAWIGDVTNQGPRARPPGLGPRG